MLTTNLQKNQREQIVDFDETIQSFNEECRHMSGGMSTYSSSSQERNSKECLTGLCSLSQKDLWEPFLNYHNYNILSPGSII